MTSSEQTQQRWVDTGHGFHFLEPRRPTQSLYRIPCLEAEAVRHGCRLRARQKCIALAYRVHFLFLLIDAICMVPKYEIMGEQHEDSMLSTPIEVLCINEAHAVYLRVRRCSEGGASELAYGSVSSSVPWYSRPFPPPPFTGLKRSRQRPCS